MVKNKLFNQRKHVMLFLLIILLIYPLANVYMREYNSSLIKTCNQIIMLLGVLEIIRFIVIDITNAVDMCFFTRIFYMSISIFVYGIFGINITFESIFRYIILCIVPNIGYFYGKSFDKHDRNVFNKWLHLFVLFIVMLEIVFAVDFFVFNGKYLGEFYKEEYTGCTVIYGPIIMGNLMQLMFALSMREVNKKNILFLIYVFLAILSGQRSAWVGLIYYSIFVISKRNRKKWIFIILAVLLMWILFTSDNYYIIKLLGRSTYKLGKFNIESVINSRLDQAIIYNKYNLFYVFFGLGASRFFIDNTDIGQPDAGYFMIFNELGLVGSVIFFLPFVLLIYVSIRNKNVFLFYLITFYLFAFYFNRILFASPVSFLFYIILGMESIDNRYTKGGRLCQ